MRNLNSGDLPISGQSVRIRELQPKDVQDLYTFESDPDVKRYLDKQPLAARDTWIAAMTKLCPNTVTLAVTDISTDELLGRASLSPQPLSSAAELQIVLGKPAWGRKLGREVASLLISAASSIGATEVTASTHPDNGHSIALLNALEFLPVGIVESPIWDNGFLKFSRKSGA